jgi:hypothetical protein
VNVSNISSVSVTATHQESLIKEIAIAQHVSRIIIKRLKKKRLFAKQGDFKDEKIHRWI